MDLLVTIFNFLAITFMFVGLWLNNKSIRQNSENITKLMIIITSINLKVDSLAKVLRDDPNIRLTEDYKLYWKETLGDQSEGSEDLAQLSFSGSRDQDSNQTP